MSNPSFAQIEAANSAAQNILALPDYDDDDEADGDDDDELPSHASHDRMNQLSDFGSPGWWLRT
jgi:hypothetical protein